MTSKQIKEFSVEYAKLLNIRFVDSSVTNKLIKLFVKRIPKRYSSFVIGMKDCIKPCAVSNMVLLDFKIGSNGGNWINQIRKMVHGAQHCLQIRDFVKKGGKVLGWYREYFKNADFRAIQEGAAIAAEAEVYYALTGIPPKEPSLKGYYVGKVGQMLSNLTYGKHIDSVIKIGKGSASFHSSGLAISLLKEIRKSA